MILHWKERLSIPSWSWSSTSNTLSLFKDSVKHILFIRSLFFSFTVTSFTFFHSCPAPLPCSPVRLNVCSSFRPVGDSPCIQDSSHRGSTRTLVLPWSEKAVSLSASPMYVYDNYKWALRWDTAISVKWTCPLRSFQKKGEELPQGSN